MKISSTILYIALIGVMLFGFAACSKKKPVEPIDNDPRATQTLKYLTQAPWKETKLEYQTQGGTWVEKPLSSVVTSVSNVFYTNGTYTVFNSNGSVSSTGTYVIVGDNTQLALNKNITYDFSILNSTTMQLALTGQMTYTDPGTGSTTTYYGRRETFVH
ncbi:MAG TPA: hypothetical protein VK668_20200 [Mucilaginibacter sp.]|nr:hypothetical protein [Mucilaginibacter sp.]